MNRYLTILFSFCALVLTIGCTSKRGLIELQTRPPGATVYLNQAKQGTTPVEFEYDFRLPATLKIEKENYYPEQESLNERWVVDEFMKGNYSEGHFTIQGRSKKAWKVKIIRKLQKNEEK